MCVPGACAGLRSALYPLEMQLQWLRELSLDPLREQYMLLTTESSSPSLPIFLLFDSFLLDTESHIVQAGLELAKTGSRSSGLHLQSTRITGLNYHTQMMKDFLITQVSFLLNILPQYKLT